MTAIFPPVVMAWQAAQPTPLKSPPAFRQPHPGLAGVRRYLGQTLPAAENIECCSGQPIVSADRAAVEWRGSWRKQVQELTVAGVKVLRVDDQGQVADHGSGPSPPPPRWPA